VGRIESPRLTRSDLAAWGESDVTPPWVRLGLDSGEYLRFVNSGDDLESWRAAGAGRFGRVILRAAGGFGGGPWHQAYAGEVLLSDQTLEPVAKAQVLEVVNDGSAAGDLEIGFGVAPFAEVTFAAVTRSGRTSYALDEDVQNQVPIPTDPDSFGMSTWQYGARLHLAPFPRWTGRPTVGVGLAYWRGKGIPESSRFERLPAPSAVLLEVLPGAEVDASPVLALALRGLVSVPVISSWVAEEREGATALTEAPEPTGDPGVGFGVQVGFVVRIGPVFDVTRAPVAPVFEDEP
jgi:hypothetical protein